MFLFVLFVVCVLCMLRFIGDNPGFVITFAGMFILLGMLLYTLGTR